MGLRRLITDQAAAAAYGDANSGDAGQMTDDQISALARKACDAWMDLPGYKDDVTYEQVAAAIKLAIAVEREDCAKLADPPSHDIESMDYMARGEYAASIRIAAAIRSRR